MWQARQIAMPTGDAASFGTREAFRGFAVALSFAAALALTACGGGGAFTFDIGVQVAGQPLSGVLIEPGAPQSVSIAAGQSIEFDASEPVVWTLQAGGSAITGSGTTVSYGGVDITQTAVSDSRIAVDTSAAYVLAAPVSITFVATSTLDSALVATVTVVIGG